MDRSASLSAQLSEQLSKQISEKFRPGERGQVFIEAILWISLFSAIAIGFLRLSVLDYRAYRRVLRNHESRSGGGSLPSPFSLRSAPTAEAARRAGSNG
jgi:hypothetical protein